MERMAIYHAETVEAHAYHYFKKLKRCNDGVQHAITSNVVVEHVERRTYFIVRRQHREAAVKPMRQNGDKVRRARLWPRTYYRLASTDYVYAYLGWDDDAPVELEAFATRREALRYLRRKHMIQLPYAESL